MQKLVFIRLFELLPLAVAALLHSSLPAHHASLLLLHPLHLLPHMQHRGTDSNINSWAAHAVVRPSLRIPRMAEATKEARGGAQGKAGGRGGGVGEGAEQADRVTAAGKTAAAVTAGSLSGASAPVWLQHLRGSGVVREAAVTVRWADACVAVLHAVSVHWQEEKRRREGDAGGREAREGEEGGSVEKRRAEDSRRGRRKNGVVPLWQWARLVVQAGEVLTEAYLRGKGEGGDHAGTHERN